MEAMAEPSLQAPVDTAVETIAPAADDAPVATPAVASGPLIPLRNATCPGHIEVHADEGGPIYINGTEGKLHKFSDSYFESTSEDVTISLTTNPDGSSSASYTGTGGAHCVCMLK